MVTKYGFDPQSGVATPCQDCALLIHTVQKGEKVSRGGNFFESFFFMPVILTLEGGGRVLIVDGRMKPQNHKRPGCYNNQNRYFFTGVVHPIKRITRCSTNLSAFGVRRKSGESHSGAG